MRDVELFDGMEFVTGVDSVHVGVLDADGARALEMGSAALPSDPMLRVLHAELGSALCWLDGVTVQLSFYEGAPLFLGEPRQRAKLVRYVAACARRFREQGSEELGVSWRDDPALVAAESLRLRRTPGAARLIVDRVAPAVSEAAR